MSLKEYRSKRNFKKTPEPKGKKGLSDKKVIFVVQKHYARRLHYDFRLQVGKKLLSWAVPKGISKSPADKRLAVHTEDHPLEYADFSGEIPEGEYGAGKVIIWDKGSYHNIKTDHNGKEISMRSCLKNGHIEVYLEGKRYKGGYALVRFKDKNWLLIKMRAKTQKYMLEKKGKKRDK